MAKKLNQSLGALAALGALGYQLSRGDKSAGGAPVEDRGTMSPMPTPEADAAVSSGPQGVGSEPSADTGDFLSRRLKVNPEDGKAYSTDNLSPMSGARASSGPAKAPAGKATTDAAAEFRASERAGRSASTGTASTQPGTMGAYKSRAGIGARETGASTQPGTMDAYRSRAGTRAGGDMPYSPPPMTAEMRRQAESQAIEPVYPEQFLGVGMGAKGLYSAGKKAIDAGKAATQAGARGRAGLRQSAEEGIDRNLASEFQNLAASSAKQASNAKTAAERTRDLNAGQAKTKFTSQSSASAKKTKKFNEEESGVEFKRGGKTKKMASGGMTSNFQRADGIASKGKTKCKIY